MKYTVCTPIAVFCCESEFTKRGLIDWLTVGRLHDTGVYDKTYRIHELLIRDTGGVWVADTLHNKLPNGQTPNEYGDKIITAEQLGF